ncbi:hypothetical protein BKA70DRAFT_1424707 [Coprinopsis sp. MPI-PUGE-AT-0042]|nr:hypothetical protein BKA70DRAFT_1424707 [Coprinopsis sp. MPI-PUGE-AT-0042]
MARPPYRGVARKLLLSFDVGTTFSGVSYSIMDPGEISEIRTVTRFPEQVQSAGDCKIPSILYYDHQGNVKAVGAEAVWEGIEGVTEEEGWTKVEWFKLHIRPKTGSLSLFDGPVVPPLPIKQGVVKVFADYVKYLHDCLKLYIKETHANGPSLWQSVEKTIDYVFTHPNG